MASDEATVFAGETLLIRADGALQRYPLRRQNVYLLGRSPDCDIVIDQPFVSRQQAELSADGSGWLVRQIGNTNPTLAAGSPLSSARLAPGAPFEIHGPDGETVTFELEAPQQATAPQEAAPQRATADTPRSRSRLVAVVAAATALLGIVAVALAILVRSELAGGTDEALDAEVGPSVSESSSSAVLSAETVFAKVSPSIAFIETPIATGSAVLIDAEHLLTNAHVVWPFAEARVTFPDGTSIDGVEVIAWDRVADLAVLRLDRLVSPQPLEIVSATSLPVGSQVFLVGYPGEFEDLPTPTISGGILARFRDWEIAGLRFVQTDAAIAGGQSGGALVSGTGEVIGISGFRIADAQFGLALDGGNAAERAQRLISGENVDGLGERLPTLVGGDRSHRFLLRNAWDQRVFVANVEAGRSVGLEVTGISDLEFRVHGPDGVEEIKVDDSTARSEAGEFIARLTGPHFVSVDQFNTSGTFLNIASQTLLTELVDADDGKQVVRGGVTIANKDHGGDVDWFELELTRGERVVISVDTVNFDAALLVDRPDNLGPELGYDDNGGGGIFGTNAEFEFTAPTSDTYLIVVGGGASATGGYFLSVR